jgi:hypothetical protein
MAGLTHVRIVPDEDRFRIVTAFLGSPIGRLAFAAAFMDGDGTGLTREEAASKAQKLDEWIDVQSSVKAKTLKK